MRYSTRSIVETPRESITSYMINHIRFTIWQYTWKVENKSYFKKKKKKKKNRRRRNQKHAPD